MLALLDEANPFAGEPPRFVRLVLYDYRFATRPPGDADGAWWRREHIAYLTEPIARAESSLRGLSALRACPRPQCTRPTRNFWRPAMSASAARACCAVSGWGSQSKTATRCW